MNTKLAIVGAGPETRELAPFDDLSFDIWTFNEVAGGSPWCRRWDACFQMHKPEIYTAWNRKHEGHWAWLQQEHGKPIWMQAYDDRVPNSMRYPLDEAIALVGYRYLTSTITYALALAAIYGYERVDIYGVEMSYSEYEYQAECYRFWIGFLKGRGVEVNLYSGAKMFEGLLYGYEGNIGFTADYFKARAAELDTQWSAAEQEAKAFKTSVERILKLDKTAQAVDAIREYHERARAVGEIAGALAEAERYAGLGDRIEDRGGFEFAAATAQKDGEMERVKFFTQTGAAEYVYNVWVQTKQPAAKAQLFQLVGQVAAQAEHYGALFGKYQENIGYIQKYDDMAKAVGVVKAG